MILAASAFGTPRVDAFAGPRPVARPRTTAAVANDDDITAAPASSVGDVVRNLHGGKYQFSDTQYLAGRSLAGRQFAESLYSGDRDDGDDAGDAEVPDALPRWAARLQNFGEQSVAPLTGTLAFDHGRTTRHAISIQNEERSWERYHAVVLPDGGGFAVASPATGTLAPRGGASHACDASRPYSDRAAIAVEWTGGEEEGAVVVPVTGGRERLLVVGTEAAAWRYRLSVA